jgi:hypothetical protein
MTTPSHKEAALEEMLEKLYGRTTAITSDVCVPKPMGCGGEATKFRNSLSQREYTISGLCQHCQDKMFGDG